MSALNHSVDSIPIVAVVGSSGCGKSAVAQHLVIQHGYVRLRFAQPLKDMLRTMGLSDVQVDGPQEVRLMPDHDLLCGKTPRYAMQTLGTEWRNYIGKRLWTNILRKRAKDIIAARSAKGIVIDDLRFIHEAEDVIEMGATILALRRPAVEPSTAELVASRVPMPKLVRQGLNLLFGIRPMHVSETEWRRITPDYSISNTGTLTDLWSAVDKLAN